MKMTVSWGSWILSVIILVLFFLSGYIMQNSVHLLLIGKRAQGIVVGVDSSTLSTSKPGEALLMSPIVEFKTANGQQIKVRGRSWDSKPSFLVGDEVKIAYSPSNPKNAQLLLWREFPIGPSSVLLGFAVVLILMWISGILISNDSKFDDPLHLLPKLIAHFKLNPYRFPVFFLLSFVIPLCIWATFSLTISAFKLRANGIEVVGQVFRFQEIKSKTNDGNTVSGVFPMITYKDVSGTSHTIKRSLAKPLSRLKPGDFVSVIYPAEHPDKGVVNT